MVIRPHPRLSPDGFVAQNVGHVISNHGSWVLLSWVDEVGVQLDVLQDEDVADWPELAPAQT